MLVSHPVSPKTRLRMYQPLQDLLAIPDIVSVKMGLWWIMTVNRHRQGVHASFLIQVKTKRCTWTFQLSAGSMPSIPVPVCYLVYLLLMLTTQSQHSG